MQSGIYQELIRLSAFLPDPMQPIRYLVAYLGSQGPYLDSKRQQEALELLLAHTKRLPLLTSVYSLGILPTVSSSFLREANRGGEIVDKLSEDSSGPFLYRPKRVVVRAQEEIPIVMAALNTPVQVTLTLRNTFDFFLLLEHVALVHEARVDTDPLDPELGRNVSMSCQPIPELHLKPQSTCNVDITIFGLEVSDITCLTLSYRCFNCSMMQPVDMASHLRIIPPLPVLDLSRLSPSDTRLELFDGQDHSILLRFRNLGPGRIDFLSVQLEEDEIQNGDYLLTSRSKTVHWDNNVLQSRLPLIGVDFILSGSP